MDILIFSIVATLTTLIIIAKGGWLKFVLRHHVGFDILYTLMFPIVMFGTFKGICVGITSGLLMSLSLLILRLTIDYEKPRTKAAP